MKAAGVLISALAVTVISFEASAQTPRTSPVNFFQPISFADIQPSGLLRDRAELNYKRLQEAYFQWLNISQCNFKPFPGDAIGRAINGLTLLAQVLHKPTPANLAEIMRRLPELENSDGYLGPKLPESRANEDVLSAHNGLVCGLAEYTRWTHNRDASATLQCVCDNLIVPAQAAIGQYRANNPQIEWHLSDGDIGQLFLMLDGATRAYEVLPSAPLKAAIETMIQRYHGIDLVAISAQTHAMLSATNGILRWYELQRRPDDLLFAKSIYRMYRGLAMTDTYENYNWINRPKWTEGCAVVDSYLLATNLWRLTGEASYLADAHLILYNGLLPGQCVNGGFGTGPCIGAVDEKGQTIVDDARHEEAPFCCSMRGAEGLARAIQYSYFLQGNDVVLPFYNENTTTLRFADGNCTVKQETQYPYAGQVRLMVTGSSLKRSKSIHLYIPPWAKKDSVSLLVNGSKMPFAMENSFAEFDLPLTRGKVIDLSFQQIDGASKSLHPEKLPGAHRYFHGALLLGSASPSGSPQSPLLDLFDPLKPGSAHVQVLFNR